MKHNYVIIDESYHIDTMSWSLLLQSFCKICDKTITTEQQHDLERRMSVDIV